MSQLSVSDIIDFVEENDVKFIRLAFCDLYGKQKNISIMPQELKHAFEEGVNFDSFLILGSFNNSSNLSFESVYILLNLYKYIYSPFLPILLCL